MSKTATRKKVFEKKHGKETRFEWAQKRRAKRNADRLQRIARRKPNRDAHRALKKAERIKNKKTKK